MSVDGNPYRSGIRTITATGDLSRSVTTEYALRLTWTDEALMAALVSRDPVAFSVVYDRYAEMVYTAAHRVLGDGQIAEDVTQEVFVRLWRRPETFVAERGKFISWIMSVSRNQAVDALRARGRRWRREGANDSDGRAQALPDERTDPVHEAQVREDQIAVREALRELPLDQRRALEMAYFGGMTQQEIAAGLHEPLGTIKTRIRLGMQKLRRSLEDRV